MKRILGIDYGQKRCGIAATDVLGIAVHPVQAIATSSLMDFLIDYMAKEPVSAIVIGMPTHADGSAIAWTSEITKFAAKCEKQWPDVSIHFQDETLTSKEASQILLVTKKKKDRRKKELVDVVSAVLILQRYLNHI